MLSVICIIRQFIKTIIYKIHQLLLPMTDNLRQNKRNENLMYSIEISVLFVN